MIKRNFLFSTAKPHALVEWLEDIHPAIYLEKLKGKADIFTFWDRIPSKTPRIGSLLKQYTIVYEQDNIAAIPLISYEYWWKNQIGKKTRNMVRKSQKKDVETKVCDLNDDLIRSIEQIYNEIPIRQGKHFTHYGEKFDQIKKGIKAVERYSQDFICAVYRDEIIGFIHLLYSKETALMSQILSLQRHWDKAPNNALIAKAVELSCQKGVQYLVYAKMSTGSLGEFKRKNGFEKMLVTRYYIPLSFKGKLILTLKLQRGLEGILPECLKNLLRPMRNHLKKAINQLKK